MQLVLAVLATVVIGSIIIAVVYFMMMIGWALAIAAFIILIVSVLYACIRDYFKSSSDKNKGP